MKDPVPSTFLAPLEKCASDIACGSTPQPIAIKRMFEALKDAHGLEGALAASWLQTIISARGETTINIGHLELIMDQSKHAGGNLTDASMNAGGDMTGVAGGINSKSTFGDVTVYAKNVDQSFAQNPTVRDALKDAHKAISEMELDGDTKEHVLKQYGDLTEELKSPSPRKGIIKSIWGGILAIAGALPAVVKLGTLIHEHFGHN